MSTSVQRTLCAFNIFFLMGLGLVAADEIEPAIPADEPLLEEIVPGLRHQAVVLDINARVVEQGKVEIWNESHQRVTIPGRAVGIKLVGSNVVVAVQFIPYLRRGKQSVLVSQGQIWVEAPGQGISYHTTMQTIPLNFNEPVYFFPLGSAKNADDARIEVMLTMRPYQNPDMPENATPVNLGGDKTQGNAGVP